jgi:hypothetical protein
MFLLLLNPLCYSTFANASTGLFGSDEKCQRAGAIDNIVCYGWVLSKTLCVTVGCYRQHRMLRLGAIGNIVCHGWVLSTTSCVAKTYCKKKDNSAIEINFHLLFRKKANHI